MTTKRKCVICEVESDSIPTTGDLLDTIFFNRTGSTDGVCSNCVIDCIDIIKDEQVASLLSEGKNVNTSSIAQHDLLPLAHLYPSDYYAMFEDDVVGQDSAKRALANAVYSHVSRVIYNESIREEDDVYLDKSNAFLIGSSGTGKTLLAKTIAKKCGLPIVIVDATTLTESGYVGSDISTILTALIEETDGDVQLAQNGIIFVDEIDKKRKRVTNHKDPSGEGVQQGLLKIVEGMTLDVNISNKIKDSPKVSMCTDNILFIFSGAFVGLDKIMDGAKPISLIKEDGEKKEKKVTPDDLIKYGMIPELVGRIPNIVKLDDLTEGMLRRILVEPTNSVIRQYQTMFSIEGLSLTFDSDVLDQIAIDAFKDKTGARSLRNKVDLLMEDIVFRIGEISEEYEEIRIDMNYYINREKLILTKKQEQPVMDESEQ